MEQVKRRMNYDMKDLSSCHVANENYPGGNERRCDLKGKI
jgi:hypothetical protein